MIFQKFLADLIDKRVRLTAPMNDPNPIEVGTEGIVYNVGLDVINVKWDNGRQLALIIDEDKFEVINNTLIYPTKSVDFEKSLVETIKDAKKESGNSKTKVTFYGYPDKNTKISDTDKQQANTPNNYLDQN